MSNEIIQSITLAAAQLGAEMSIKAMAEGDTQFFRDMHKISIDLYDAMIELAKGKPDYPTWRDAFIKANVESPMNQLDTSGRFTAMVEQAKNLDMSGYYFQEVMPVLRAGLVPLYQERAALDAHYKGAIEMCAQVRRDKMTDV